MAFPYLNSLAEYTAVFPSEIYVPREFRNLASDGYAVVEEQVAIPVSADSDGRRRMNLDLVPMDLPGVVVEVEGDPRSIVPYGEAPAAGEVALSLETGVIEFHEDDAGDECLVSYTGRGTPVMAYAWAAIQKELAATQEELEDLAEQVETLDLGDEVSTVTPGASATLTPSTGVVRISSLLATNRTLANPNIANGTTEGQRVTVVNESTNTVTFTNGQNVRLPSGTVVLGQWDAISFVWTADGKWICTAYVNNS